MANSATMTMKGTTAGDLEDFDDFSVFAGSWNLNSLVLLLFCFCQGVVSTPV